jgi:hypothetical protein
MAEGNIGGDERERTGPGTLRAFAYGKSLIPLERKRSDRDVDDTGERRSFRRKTADELGDRRTFDIDVHAIRGIGNVPGKTEAGRKGINIWPETDSLDDPGYCDLSPFSH